MGLTGVGHLLFGLVVDGFWSALACRALTGSGWAGTDMTGSQTVADRVDGRDDVSCNSSEMLASIGLSGALSFARLAIGWLALPDGNRPLLQHQSVCSSHGS